VSNLGLGPTRLHAYATRFGHLGRHLVGEPGELEPGEVAVSDPHQHLPFDLFVHAFDERPPRNRAVQVRGFRHLSWHREVEERRHTPRHAGDGNLSAERLDTLERRAVEDVQEKRFLVRRQSPLDAPTLSQAPESVKIGRLASDPPRPNVLFQTYIAGQRLAALLDRHMEAAGVASNDFGLLSALGVWGPITPTELASRVGMPPTTLSSALARAGARGLVRRLPHPSDRRSYLVELSEDGDRAWRAGWPALRAALERLERELAGSLDDVQDAIGRLDAAARAALDEAAISQ
jgi:DNA-binding MarR family transcriptional regulator